MRTFLNFQDVLKFCLQIVRVQCNSFFGGGGGEGEMGESNFCLHILKKVLFMYNKNAKYN